MDKVVGVMNLASNQVISLDQNMIDLFSAIGNQIAVAANNARLYEDIKAKNEMIKFFAYSVSHDLKSPAIGLHGLAKRLKEKYGASLDDKGKTYCDQIMIGSENIAALVESINAFIVTKERPLNLERIKFEEVMDAIRNEFSTPLLKRQIRWSEPDDLPEIIADRLSLSRLFRNLIENSLKYGGKELHEIRVSYEQNGSFHIFSFSDDGVGIESADKDKVFEMFHRNKTSKGTSGSGLGLAIVKEIAERHQGQAWIESGTGKGTTVRISISKDLGKA
jgi:light-regulated signal transduction histidine kinase (bacteriophytochrome)